MGGPARCQPLPQPHVPRGTYHVHSIQDADSQSHEGFGEVNDLLPLGCDGKCSHSQVCLLLEGKQGGGMGVGQGDRRAVREKRTESATERNYQKPKERRTEGDKSLHWPQGCTVCQKLDAHHPTSTLRGSCGLLPARLHTPSNSPCSHQVHQ